MNVIVERIFAYLRSLGDMNSNIKRLFTSTALNSVSQGIFLVVFNLYILNMGISPDILGWILSAGPYAQALGSIPIGFLMEIIGFKKVFLIIYLGAGLARIFQVVTPVVPLILLAAFTGGLALAGDFVVRLPFLAANADETQHNKVYSVSSILMAICVAAGSLLGGYIPNLFIQILSVDLTIAYRYTLLIAGFLSLAAVLPIIKVRDLPIGHKRKISLKPYLWGLDRFTGFQAIVSLFVGLGLGIVNPFMNIIFIYRLETTLEFFATVSALVLIPSLIVTSLAPLLAKLIGSVRSVTYMRSTAAASLVGLAITTNPWLGSLYFWAVKSFTGGSQPLSFAFAMRAAKPQAKSAAAAWLNVTFWLGNGIAANLGGSFIAQSNYKLLLFIGAGSILAAGLFNEFFFHKHEQSLNQSAVIDEQISLGASE